MKDTRRPASILVPAYTGLGNFILKTPMIRELRRLYPDARIDVLAGNGYGAEFVLAHSGIVNDTHILPLGAPRGDWIRFFLNARGRYDTIFLFFDTAHVHRLYWGALLAGIRQRVGHVDCPMMPLKAWMRATLTHRVPFRRGESEAYLNFDLLSALDPRATRTSSQFVYCPHQASPEIARIFQQRDLKPGHYICLQAGAASGGATPKVWPVEHFRRLADALRAQGLAVVVLGDRSDEARAGQICEGKPFVTNLTGLTTIGDAAWLLRHAAAVVCHDSGLMHMADALAVPLVALYGPTDYERTRPLAESSLVLRHRLECAPCLVPGGWSEADAVAKCPRQFLCMSEISPELVAQKVGRIAGEGARAP